MSIKKHLPNALTTGNAVCGSIGIIFIFQGELFLASSMVWLAAILDFFDGFVARLVKVSSPFGKELDSLADMISFGALPGFYMYHMLGNSTGNEYLPYLAMLIIALSALRLAKFNLDTRQTDVFYGLPTPANALFITSLPALAEIDLFQGWLLSFPSLSTITLIFSLLLVAELKLMSLKFKNFGFQENLPKYLLIGLSLVLLLIWNIKAISLIILGYLLVSGVMNLKERSN